MNSFLKKAKKNLSDINNKRKLKKYYIEKTKNGKTYIAIVLDKIFIKVIVALAFFLYFFFETQDFIFAAIISVQFFLLYSLISYKIRKRKLESSIEDIHRELARGKIYEDLINETSLDFSERVKSTLEKCNIEDIKLLNQKHLDMTGYINGEIIGIKYFQYNEDHKVTVNSIREFFLTLKNIGIKNGVIITTSSFVEDAKSFLPKLKNHISIHLVNLDGFISIMRKAGTYPTDKELEGLILEKISDNRRKLVEYRNTVLSKGKATKYIVLSIIIFFWGKITPYKFYYSIASYLLLILGLISMGKYLLSLMKQNEDESDDTFI